MSATFHKTAVYGRHIRVTCRIVLPMIHSHSGRPIAACRCGLRGPVLDSLRLPSVVTVLFHGELREMPISPKAVTLPLYVMLHRRDEKLRSPH